MQLDKQLFGAVVGRCMLGHRSRPDLTCLGQLFPESLGEVGHRVERIDPILHNPLAQLFRTELGLSQFFNGVRQLLADDLFYEINHAFGPQSEGGGKIRENGLPMVNGYRIRYIS